MPDLALDPNSPDEAIRRRYGILGQDPGDQAKVADTGSVGFHSGNYGVRSQELAAATPAQQASVAASLKPFENMEQRLYGARNMLPFVLSMLTGALAPVFGPMIGGALGLSGLAGTTVGDALASGFGGALSSASGGGNPLEGLLMGGVSGGLGALGGAGLGRLLGGFSAGAGSAAGAAGDAAGSLGSAAGEIGSAVGGLPDVVQELVVNGISPLASTATSLGSAAGSLSGLYGMDQSASAHPDFGASTAQDWANVQNVLNGTLVPTIAGPGAGAPGGGSGDGANAVQEVQVAGRTPSPPLNAGSFLTDAPGLTNTPQQLADDASRIGQDHRDTKPVQDSLKDLLKNFPQLAPTTPNFRWPTFTHPGGPGGGTGGNPGGGTPDIFTPGPGGPGGGPGNPASGPSDLFKPTQGPTAQGTHTGSPMGNPSFQQKTGSPFGGGGAGPAGLGAINLKGSAAPDIYPWSTVV